MVSGYKEPTGGTASEPSTTQFGSKPVRAIMKLHAGVELDTAPGYGEDYIPRLRTPWHIRANKLHIDNTDVEADGQFSQQFELEPLEADQVLKIPIIEHVEADIRKDEPVLLNQTQTVRSKTIPITGSNPNVIQDLTATSSHIAGFDGTGTLTKLSTIPIATTEGIRKFQNLESYGDVQFRSYDIMGDGHLEGIQYYGDNMGGDNDSTGYWIRLQSLAAAGEFAGLAHIGDLQHSFRRDKNGWITAKTQTFATDYPMTNQRFVFGFWDQRALPPDSDTLIASNQHGFYIAFRSGVDTNYRILHNDATGTMVDDNSTLAFPTTSTAHEFQIKLDNSTGAIHWIIRNFSGGTILASGTVTTRIPGATIKLYAFCGMIGNTKSILMRNFQCKTGGH